MILGIFAAAVFLVSGCASTPDEKQRQCSAARAAEAAYDALIASGHTPSEGEALAAAAIKAFIGFHCTVPPQVNALEQPAPPVFRWPENDFHRRYNFWLEGKE